MPNTNTHPALCVSPHCGGGHPNPTGGRTNLCHACQDTTRADLNLITATWPDLEAARTQQSTATDGRVGTPTPGIVINETVVDTIRAATATITHYAVLVRDSRHVTIPPPATPPSLAAWISRSHVSWLSGNITPEESAAFTTDIGATRRRVWSAAHPVQRRWIEIPDLRCPTLIPSTGEDDGPAVTVCGAAMHTTLVVPSDDRLHDLVCENGHHTPPSKWPRLARQPGRDLLSRDAMTRLVKHLSSPRKHTTSTQDDR